MKKLIATIIMLAWGLWFGGIVMVMLAVNSLFDTFGTDRTAAGMAATGIFHRFEIYQLVLGAVAVGATLLWRGAPRFSRRALLVCLIAAALCAIAMTAFITPTIEDMRVTGQTQTVEFRQWHMISVIAYIGETALLLLAGIFLGAAMLRSVGGDNEVAPPADHVAETAR